MKEKNKKGIYKKDGKWYIRYKDPNDNKWKGRSTGLSATKKNEQEALRISNEFNKELDKVSEEIKQSSYKKGTIQEAFDHFKKVSSVNKDPGTIQTYDYFFEFFKEKFPPEALCITITKESSEEFLIWLSGLEDYAQNTKFGINKNLKKFLRFLFEYQYLPKLFVLNRDLNIKPEVNEPVPFSENDRRLLVSNLETKKKNSNFKLMIYMLMFTGWRPSDILSITADRVDLEKQTIRMYSSKVKRWLKQPFPAILKPLLSSRIDEVKEGPLFNYENEQAVGHAFRDYLKQIGLKGKGYTLRTFRKDYISQGQLAGIPIAIVSRLVGHSDIKTTDTYYTYFSAENLHSELKKLRYDEATVNKINLKKNRKRHGKKRTINIRNESLKQKKNEE